MPLHWNATTRLFDDRDNNRANNMDYFHGTTPKRLKHNIHNEYFSIVHPEDAELDGISLADQAKILYENSAALNELRPA